MAVYWTFVAHLLLMCVHQETLQAKSFLSDTYIPLEQNSSENFSYNSPEDLISKVLENEWTKGKISEMPEKTAERLGQLLSDSWTDEGGSLVGENKSNTWKKIGEKNKRLMGIFRCTGWGPGCTPLEGKVGRKGKGRSKFRETEMFNKMYRTGGQGSTDEGSSRSGRMKTGGRSRNKFQPFFTLTSGGSWGPTGKRSVPKVAKRKRNSSVDGLKTLYAERAAMRHLASGWGTTV